MKNNHDSFTGTDQTIARKHNRALVLNCIRLQGSVSRANLAKQLGLTRSTISRIIEELINEKLVYEGESVSNGRGRPGTPLLLNAQGGAAIGLEIGVNFISILLTDFLSNPIWRKRLILKKGCKYEDYVNKAEELIQIAIDKTKEMNLPLMGIGIAVWGLVSNQKNLIRYAPNLNWRDVPLGKKWQEKYNVQVITENDANASALGEYYFGVGKGSENYIYLSIDVGVGSGIISKGHLFRGADGFAGEIGHITIEPDGDLCSCGKRGCLETKVGRDVIMRKYKELSKDDSDITLDEIIKRGEEGDEFAKQIFDEAGESLGFGISYCVNLINPRSVILGWSLGQAYDLLLPGIKRGLKEHGMPDLCETLSILPSSNGPDAVLLGSIALVLDEIIRETTY
jgi:predicted NBD/HSP70 family sugar kinase